MQKYQLILPPLEVAATIDYSPPLRDIRGKAIIVTGTWYPGEASRGVRAERAYRMIQNSRELGLDVLVMDGGSDKYFLDRIKELGPHTERQNPGMGPGRREGFRLAREEARSRGIPYLGWTEPEKDSLTQDYARFLSPLEKGAACVRPLRTEKSWYTCPEHQRYAETAQNIGMADTFGFFADHSIGPFFWRLEHSDYVLERYERIISSMEIPQELAGWKFREDDRWGSNIFPPILMHAAGLRVVSVETDFPYPPDQRAEEEGNPKNNEKRNFQLSFLTLAGHALKKYLSPTDGR